jgi:5'-methylthioadenosine phosphorylase
MGEQVQIGIIGGTGLYQMEGFTGVRELAVDTPFGKPSDSLMVGELAGRAVAFLPRHGRGHRILPHELNFQANVFAMKSLGVEFLLSVSAVGSLKDAYAPLDMLIPDQFIDRTQQRRSTFFGRGLVAHVGFAHPFCPLLSKRFAEACSEARAKHHVGGTYVCIEGPHFSTLAESKLYRSWGADVVGMTNLQEAKLAREAEICYATLALVTDYDCWHPDHDSVTVDLIIANLMQNAATAQKTIAEAVDRIRGARACACRDALATAIITQPPLWPEQTKKELEPILRKYMR